MMNNIEYAIIVKNKTRLESLIERFNTKAQAKFYIESKGGDFDDYLAEDEIFYSSLNTLQRRLSTRLKNKIVERQFVPSFIFSPQNVIVVIGQDGLVANTAKYAGGCPIVAVNPEKSRYDGVLLPFDCESFMTGVEQVVAGQYPHRRVNFAEARLNDGQRLLAFNDLFIGASTHISARYKIDYNQHVEEQSSSGIIVSTKAGSTGWLSSVFNMAYGVVSMADRDIKLKHPKFNNDNSLLFAVREPFKSVRTQSDIVAGVVGQNDVLRIESYMPSNGVIISDGIESDFLHFNSGSIVSIGIAKDEFANLVPL